MVHKIVLSFVISTMCIGFCACGNTSTGDTAIEDTMVIETSDHVNEQEEDTRDQIDLFVDSYNLQSENHLIFVEEFIPTEDGPHHRHEFKEPSYLWPLGKSYSYGESTVDIVTQFGGNMRIYMDNATKEQCLEIVKIASPIMDETVTSEEIQELFDYIEEWGDANGQLLGEDITVCYLGNPKNGYQLMIKTGL